MIIGWHVLIIIISGIMHMIGTGCNSNLVRIITCIVMQWHCYLDFEKDVLIIIIIKPVSRCDVLLY